MSETTPKKRFADIMDDAVDVANAPVSPVTNRVEVEQTAQQPIQPKPTGRPVKENKLTRENSKPTTVFVDRETEYKLGDIKNYDKLDIKDVMLAATIEFLDRHFHGRQLTTSGKEIVERRIAEVVERTKLH